MTMVWAFVFEDGTTFDGTVEEREKKFPDKKVKEKIPLYNEEDEKLHIRDINDLLNASE